jgi:hypothetical protein
MLAGNNPMHRRGHGAYDRITNLLARQHVDDVEQQQR